MELFLPGLLVLLISAFFGFVVIPKFGPVILVSVSVIVLFLVLGHHYSLFYSEYRLSTWQNTLGAYAPFLVLGVALFFIFSVAASILNGNDFVESIMAPVHIVQNAANSAIETLPTASSATNPITAGINSLLKTNTNAKRESSMIPALGYRASNV